MEVTEVAKRGDPLTSPATHPVADEVHVVTTLGQQRERAVTLLVPVTAHERVGKMPETNLQMQYNDKFLKSFLSYGVFLFICTFIYF